MRKPAFGEFNLGALAGLVAGGIGGLFAVGIAPALLHRDPSLLFGMRILSVMSWLVCGATGWFLGGQLGPRFGDVFNSERAEILGGVLGGLLPVILIALWAWWYTVTQ